MLRNYALHPARSRAAGTPSSGTSTAPEYVDLLGRHRRLSARPRAPRRRRGGLAPGLDAGAHEQPLSARARPVALAERLAALVPARRACSSARTVRRPTRRRSRSARKRGNARPLPDRLDARRLPRTRRGLPRGDGHAREARAVRAAARPGVEFRVPWLGRGLAFGRRRAHGGGRRRAGPGRGGVILPPDATSRRLADLRRRTALC